MICSRCGGPVTWRGPWSNLSHTECERCGARNAQVSEEDFDDINDEILDPED
jgi:hypothetical protein